MRTRLERRTHRHDRESEHADVSTTERESGADGLKHEMDDILDEIDAVLEQNAEEFINGYIQKGGE